MRSKKYIKILILSLFPFTLNYAFMSDHTIISVKYKNDSVNNYGSYLISPDTIRTNEEYDSTKVLDRSIHLLWNNSEWLSSAHNSSKVITNPSSVFQNGNIKIEKIKLAHVDESDGFFKSTTFKVLMGSAVLLGGTAAYFKIKGDKKYESYLINKDNHTLNEVNRYDLYSGISFGLLQINFGYLLYKFIIE